MAQVLEQLRFDFDFLFYREGEWVIAHCLQTDTAAQGATVEEAKAALKSALELEIDAAIKAHDLAGVFAIQAPAELWDQINHAARHTYVLEAWSLPQRSVHVKQHLLADVE